MPEISSLFNLNADTVAQYPVNASGNAVAGSNGFAAQLASAMGQGGETSQESTGGKNIPLRMTAGTKNTDTEKTTELNLNAEAALENINPPLLATPVIFSDPIQLAGATQESESKESSTTNDTPPEKVSTEKVPTRQASVPTAPAVNPAPLTNLSSQPMGISQTAEDYIAGLAISKPDISSEAVVLPSANGEAQHTKSVNLPFVPQAVRTSPIEPVRLQFNDPIELAKPASSVDTPEAGGLRAVTPASEPLYLSSLIPANRAAIDTGQPKAEQPVPNLPDEAGIEIDTADSEETTATTATNEEAPTQDIDAIWTGFKVMASDVKNALAGPGADSIVKRAEPLKVANTFHQPLQMTATVGKPMTESAMQGYKLSDIATAPTASSDQASLATNGQQKPVEPNSQQAMVDTAKPAQLAQPVQPAQPTQLAQPQSAITTTESAQESIEANPQPYVEIKKIQPELFEQRTMDYMKRSIAADTLVLNNSATGSKEGQNPQNQQQDKPAADGQAIQNGTTSKPAETNITPASNTVQPQPQSELASGRIAPVTERTTLANTSKEPQTEHVQPEKQTVERAFMLPEQNEQPKQAKAEERVLRWESAKDAVNLAKLVQQAGQSGVSKLTVRLTPENLGRLEIQLTEIGGRIDAKIMANSTESRALLASNGEAIRQQLADKGIQINNMDFSFHDSLTRQDQNDHGRGAGQEAKQGRFNLAKGDSIDFEQALTEQEQTNAAGALYA